MSLASDDSGGCYSKHLLLILLALFLGLRHARHEPEVVGENRPAHSELPMLDLGSGFAAFDEVG